MIKLLILIAIQALVLCDWTGYWQVSSTNSLSYNQCDLPPSSSIVTISNSPSGTMTFTRFSEVLNINITQPLGWSSSQADGSACYPTYGYCINGNLSSSSATLYWYPPNSESTGCQLVLTPVLPSWIGQWVVTASHSMDYCPVPGVNTQVTITNGPTGLTMTGTDASTLETRTWNLNWTPNEQTVGDTCEDYLCTSGSLTTSGSTLTATIDWAEDTIYQCYVTMTQSE